MPTVFFKHGAGNTVLRSVDNQVAIDPACCCGPFLLCDSISAFRQKCGFLGYGEPDEPLHVWYRTNTYVNSGSLAATETDCDGIYGTASLDFDYTSVLTYDPSLCTVSSSCDGTSTLTSSVMGESFDESMFSCDGGTNCCFAHGPPELFSHAFGGCFPDSDDITVDEQTYTVYHAHTDNITLSQELSDLYTTDLLISTTVGALPAYSGDFGSGACEAIRSLQDQAISGDEGFYHIQRFKYKFREGFAPVAGSILYWNEHFVPDVGSPSDTARSFTFDGVETETSVLEVIEPSENGSITITDVSWTAP